MPPPNRRQFTTISVLCLGYLAVLLPLVGRLSLWLDEVLQLIGTRGRTVVEIIQYAATNPGGIPNPGATPLGYLVQGALVNGLGYSLLSARLSSILCSVVACAAVWAIAAGIQSPARRAAVLVFMLLPFQFRYALEARPYSQALMFSALSTVVLLELLKRFTLAKAFLYGAIVVLGLYSQPFSIFIPLAHLLWATFYARTVSDSMRVRNAILLAVVAAAALFVPWFLYVRMAWKSGIELMSQGAGFHITVRTPLMILREFSGAGFWGSALLLIAAGLGLLSPSLDRKKRTLLCLLIAVPIAGALGADAVFGYFAAIRQMIFILPAMALLAGEGLRYACQRRVSIGWVLAAALFAVSLWYDVHWFSRPREDWKAAAAMLSHATPAACILPVPSDALRLYSFFAPELRNQVCGLDAGHQAALVLSPYRSAEDEKAAYAWLAAAGFRRKPGEASAGGTIMLRFERP